MPFPPHNRMIETRDEFGHGHAPFPNDFDARMMGLAVWQRRAGERAEDGGRDTATNGRVNGHASGRKAVGASKENEPEDPPR